MLQLERSCWELRAGKGGQKETLLTLNVVIVVAIALVVLVLSKLLFMQILVWLIINNFIYFKT